MFLSSSSHSFLSPIFPKSVVLAQYSGVSRAAALVHDEHIGIGSHYHLYQLPDSLERSAFSYLRDDRNNEIIQAKLKSRESAMIWLRDLLGKDEYLLEAEGPVAIGDYSDSSLELLIKQALGYYLVAFERNLKVFPYMRTN